MSSNFNDRIDGTEDGGEDDRSIGLQEIAAAFGDLDVHGSAILRGVAARVGEDLTGFGAGVAPAAAGGSVPGAEVDGAASDANATADSAELEGARPEGLRLEGLRLEGPQFKLVDEVGVDLPGELPGSASSAASGWAGWLKRAAVLAPAGSVKLATTGGGKAAVGAKGASTLLVGGAAVVLAATVVALVGILASTFRLARGGAGEGGPASGGGPAGGESSKKKAAPFAFLDRDHPFSKSIYLWITWIGYASVLVFSGGVGTRAAFQAVIGIVLVVGTAATIWVAHAAREATFEGLGRTLASFLGGIGGILMIGGGLGSARLSEVFGPLLLILVSFSIMTILRAREDTRAVSRAAEGGGSAVRSIRLKIGMTFLAFGLMGWLLSHRTFGTTPMELVEYVNTFERSPDDLLEWEELADVARGIGSEGASQVDRVRLRALLGSDLEELHPGTVSGALALGLFSRADLEQLAEREWREARLFGLSGSVFMEDLHAGVLAAQLDGGLNASQRSSLQARLERCWPEATEYGALERAADVLRIAEAGGLDGFGPGRAGEIRRLLEERVIKSWGPFQANGYTSKEVPERPSALTYVGHGRVDQSASAIELMGHLKRYDSAVFDELDVDMPALGRFLEEEMEVHRVGTLVAFTLGESPPAVFLGDAPSAAGALMSLRKMAGSRVDDPFYRATRWIYLGGMLVALGLALGTLASARRDERAFYGPA